MALLKKHQVGGKVSIVPEGGWKEFDKSIGDLSSRFEKKYGNFDQAISELSRRSNSELKEELAQEAIKYAQDYISAYNKSTNKENWQKVKEAQDFLNYTSNEDPKSEEGWTKFKNFANPLGWDLDRYFTQSDEEEKEQIAANAEEKTRQAQVEAYKNLGINDESLQNHLYQSGFTNTNLDDLDPYIRDYFKSKGYSSLANADGHRYVFDSQGKLVENDFGLLTEDQFSDNYGKVFQISKGVFGTGDYSEEFASFLPKFTDQGNIRRRLNWTPLEGYVDELWGESNDDFRNNFTRDIFGRRDYTSTLHLTTNDGRRITAERLDDGTYRTEDGQIINPQLTGFGEEFEEIRPTVEQAIYQFNPNWDKIKSDNPNDWLERWTRSLNRMIKSSDTVEKVHGKTPTSGIFKGTYQTPENLDNWISQNETKLEDSLRTGKMPSELINNTKWIAERVKWFIEQGGKPNATDQEKADSEKASELAYRLNRLWSKAVDTQGNPLIAFKKGGVMIKPKNRGKFTRWAKSHGMTVKEATSKVLANKEKYSPSVVKMANFSRNFGKNKNGGIIKAQQGDVLTQILEKNKALNKPKSSTPSSGFSGIKYGTSLKDASPLQLLSLGATGASFIPGLGVVGGAVSTVADAIEGSRDGWDKSDLRNLAANLGFTALGAVGLGGAAKLAVKGAQTASKLGKSADIAVDVAKAVNKGKRLGEGGKELLKGAERAQKALSKGKSIKPNDLAKVEELLKLNPSWVGRKVDSVKNAAKYIVNKSPNLIKAGLVGNQLIQGGTGAVNVAQSINEHGFWKGLAEANVDDIRRVTQLGAAAKMTQRNIRLRKAIDKHTSLADPQNTIEFNGVKYNINQTINSPKGRYNWKVWEGKKLSDKDLKAVEAQLKESLKGNSSKVINQILNQVKENRSLSGLKFDQTGSGLVMNTSPGSTTLRDIIAFNRASEALRRGTGNTALFRRNLPTKKQKGGKILKYRNGKPIINYNKDTINIGKYLYPYANPDKLPYTPTTQVSPNWQIVQGGGYTDQYTDYVNAVNEDFYNKHIPAITEFVNRHKGNYIPKDYRDLQRLMSDGKYGPIHNWTLQQMETDLKLQHPSIISRSIRNPRGLPTLDLSTGPLRFSNPNISERHPLLNQPISERIGLIDPNWLNNRPTNSNDPEIDAYNPIEYNPKKFTDWKVPAELLRFGIGERFNALATNAGISGVTQLPRLNTRSNVYLRTQLPNTVRAMEAAGNLRSQGNRLSTATSDFNASALLNLEANRNAIGLEQEGFARDTELNNATRLEQARINDNVDQYNSQVMDKNSAMSAEARRNVYNLIARSYNLTGMNRQNLVSEMYRANQMRPYKEALHDYNQRLFDPNIQGSTDYYQYLMSPEVEQAYKSEYEKQVASAEPDSVIPKFEDWEQYKALQNLRKQFADKTISPQYRDLNLAQQRIAAIMQSIMLQKGGRMPLYERIILENVKYNHKRLLNYERDYYQSVLKKAELLQKAMNKVFK